MTSCIIIAIFFVALMAYIGTRKYYLDRETRRIRRKISETPMMYLALVITTIYTMVGIRAEVDALAEMLNPFFDQFQAVGTIIVIAIVFAILIVYGFILYYTSVISGNLAAAHLRRQRNQF